MSLLKEIQFFTGYCAWASLTTQEIRGLPGKRWLATVNSLCTAYKTVSSPPAYLGKTEKQKGFIVFCHLPAQSREFVFIWMSKIWDRSIVCMKQSNYWLQRFTPGNQVLKYSDFQFCYSITVLPTSLEFLLVCSGIQWIRDLMFGK